MFLVLSLLTKPMARPSALTKQRAQAVADAIREGATRNVAAGAAGVGPATLYRWLARGQEPGAPENYRAFVAAVEKAEADAQLQMIKIVRKAAENTWQAAAWWLERKYPDEWGRRDRVSIEGLIEREADRIARDLGLDPEEVVATAQLILRGRS